MIDHSPCEIATEAQVRQSDGLVLWRAARAFSLSHRERNRMLRVA